MQKIVPSESVYAVLAVIIALSIFIASGLEYTIIRPRSLSGMPAAGASSLCDDPEKFGVIS